jgi:hypothetical protein
VGRQIRVPIVSYSFKYLVYWWIIDLVTAICSLLK